MVDNDQWWMTIINDYWKWSMTIDDDRWWLIMINNNWWWLTGIHGNGQWLMMMDDDRWLSMMIDDDRRWSMMINNERWWSMMIVNPYCTETTISSSIHSTTGKLTAILLRNDSKVHVLPQEGKLHLRRHEGIKEWFNMIQVKKPVKVDVLPI